MARDRWDLGGE
jgi:uncharacterized protein YuzB (UPF0349 family)